MLAKIRRNKNILILFLSLLAANVTVFNGVIWLFPQIILFSFFIWFFLALACFLIARQQRLSNTFITFALKNWYIFPFLIFSGLSIFWSVDWQVSLLRWLTLFATLVVGVYLGYRYPLADIFRFISLFIAGLFLFNVFYVVLLPDFGVMNYYSIQGAWKGIFWHKNHLGFIVAFSSLFFLINMVLAYGQRQKATLAFLGAYLFSLFVLFKTDSVGAILTLVVAHGVVFIGLAYINFAHRLKRVHYIFLAGLFFIILLVVLLNLDTVFGFFGRNTTMTGRLPMWGYVFETYLSQKPFFGYGFNAFWYVADYRVDIGLAARYPDPIVIADNGFLDILFNTGYIGLILFLFFYGNALWKSFIFAIRGKNILDLFPLILLVFITVANISWTILFENESFFFLILVIVLSSVSFYSTSDQKLSPQI
jgi:exopolysaccharide production protein ExoQ